ncbi:hypothetical protein KKF34_01435 [Myxococcota bacterium]|nr:hypothetical protein [Myxococcota bacterium]MBU1380065.1 hypothetical protein [Myxococcota bacterium]MBU1495523.1 hypothetical protein [Myxococcota bacterium]
MDKENKNEISEPEEIPPAILRRRKTPAYRVNTSSQTFDWVIIIIALGAALIMIKTRGCNTSLKNMAEFFTNTTQNTSQVEDKINEGK